MKKISALLDEKLPISGINIWLVEIAMRRSFTTSFGSITKRPFFVVELVSEQSSGYGETAVLPEPVETYEDMETAKRMLSMMSPQIVRMERVSYNNIKNVMSRYKGHNMAKSAIDYAFWYLLSKSEGIPLLSMTAPSKDAFRVRESVPIGTTDQVARWVEGAYARGIRSIKLKIMPGRSWRVAKFVRDSYKPSFLSVDANASFDPRNSEHINELHKVSEHVDEIEQPFRSKNLLAHAQLAKDVEPVVSLDESIEGLDDAIEYNELAGKKAVINIKPPRVGGLYSAWELAVEMERRGSECFVGGLLEFSLGRGFNMAIATMKGVCERYPADFSPPSDFYKDDITKTSFEIKSGIINAPRSETVPFEVDRKKLKMYGKIVASY